MTVAQKIIVLVIVLVFAPMAGGFGVVRFIDSFDRYPPGGRDAYCFEFTYDPTGLSNDIVGVTNAEPVIEAGVVTLRDVWIDEDPNMTDRYHFEAGPIRLLSDADVRIKSRCP